MESEYKHTKGPWGLAWEDGKHGVIAEASNGRLIAIIGNDPMSSEERQEERKANAVLMAAALRMLEEHEETLALLIELRERCIDVVMRHAVQQRIDATLAVIKLATEYTRPEPVLPQETQSTKHSSPCLQNAADNEPIFVLRAQDNTSHTIVTLWAGLHVPRLGLDHPKIKKALATAEAMEAWPNRKLPD